MQVNQFLEDSTENFPDKDAIWYDNKWLTYSEIDALSNKVSNFLKSNQIKRGDRVAILDWSDHRRP